MGKTKSHKVLMQDWDESEAGWGVRPDGASFHLSPDQLQRYLDKYYKSLPKEVPHEYSRISSSPREVFVDLDLFNKVTHSALGYRMEQYELREYNLTDTPKTLCKKTA